jgi:hypothetical protein
MAIEASLIWQSQQAHHRDAVLLVESALLADGRWARVTEQLRGLSDAKVELDPAPWLQPAAQAIVDIPVNQFRLYTQPVAGRFYPRMAFTGLAQNPRDMRPTRLVDVADDLLKVDPNHPLAGVNASLVFQNSTLEPTRGVRMVELFDGPGMQVSATNPAQTYFEPAGLVPQNTEADDVFYALTRMSHHLDAVCRAEITALYRRLLKPGQRVLDLMSSWVSHLPEELEGLSVAGLGMNLTELYANSRLIDCVVQDLNTQPKLPWGAAEFDVVVCTASIEYLRHPQAVMAEVKRVLKPGGVCVITFSDRWFPTKAIRVWSQLHSFERLGLVLTLLRDAGLVDLHSETRRGLKRPDDDKYIDQRLYSDPLFAAWGFQPA